MIMVTEIYPDYAENIVCILMCLQTCVYCLKGFTHLFREM